MDDFVDEDSNEHDGSGAWPFSNFVEQLIHDIFDAGEVFSLLKTLCACHSCRHTTYLM